MPIISIFFGIIIRVFHKDHHPPHFHVQYGEFKAIIEIKTGKILHGKLPKRTHRLVSEWRKLHLFEIQKAWDEAQELKNPRKIKPLE